MRNLYENAKSPNHQDTLEKQAGHTFPIRHEDLKSSVDESRRKEMKYGRE